MTIRNFSLFIPLLAGCLAVSCSVPVRRPASNAGPPKAEPSQSPRETPIPRSLPVRAGFVNDHAEVLDPMEKAQLENFLNDKSKEMNVDLVVLTVRSTEGISAFDYSLEIAREWEIGGDKPEKKGALLLVSTEDRTWHIQTSKTLEKLLPNEEVARIGQTMIPDFKQERWGQGIKACAEEFFRALKDVSASRKALPVSSGAI